MKKNTNIKIKLGIFISLGIAVFIMAIYFIGERQQLFRSTFHISGIFKDVAGLQVGSNVRFAGITVGTVESIDIVSDSTVRVEIVIDESTRKFIKRDAIASIGSEGLMGNKILIINPGPGLEKEIQHNDIIKTVQPINLDEVLLSLKTTIDHTSQITYDLSKITSYIETGKGTIGRLVMDQTLARNIDEAIINLKLGSSGFKNLVDDATLSFDQNWDSTFVNLKESSLGLKILLNKAKDSWVLWGF